LASSTQSLPPVLPPVQAASSNPKLTQIKWGRWTRVLAPSFSDCFFIALLAWLFVCGPNGWKALLTDGDTGWHIRTGQYILAQHTVPHQDLFSFSKPGEPWFAWEWLADVLYGWLFGIGGLKAVVLFAGVLIAAYATLLLRYTIWRGSNTLLAALMILLAVGGSSMHFLARPHLFTLLFLPASLWLIEADRRERTRFLWLLIPLTALWANLHGGFVVFLACLALLVVGSAMEAFLGRGRLEAAGRYALLFLGCSAASFINPYGAALHVHIISYLRADWIKNLVQEFQAPTFRTEGQLQFEILLFAGLVVTGFLLQKRRVTEALWLLFLAHSSITSVRHAPLYAAVAAPLVASELSTWWRTFADRSKKSSLLRILHQLGEDIAPAFRWTSVWPAAVVVVLIFLNAPVQWPRDFPSEMFPVAMVQENADLLRSGRLLTTDQWGDYMIFRYYPQQKVFVDGRSDFYGESLGTEYIHLLQGQYDWQAILARHGFEVALLPSNWPLSQLLKLDPSWRVVKDDSRSVLFVRLSHQSPTN
jgi:hypothetical protein